MASGIDTAVVGLVGVGVGGLIGVVRDVVTNQLGKGREQELQYLLFQRENLVNLQIGYIDLHQMALTGQPEEGTEAANDQFYTKALQVIAIASRIDDDVVRATGNRYVTSAISRFSNDEDKDDPGDESPSKIEFAELAVHLMDTIGTVLRSIDLQLSRGGWFRRGLLGKLLGQDSSES